MKNKHKNIMELSEEIDFPKELVKEVEKFLARRAHA